MSDSSASQSMGRFPQKLKNSVSTTLQGIKNVQHLIYSDCIFSVFLTILLGSLISISYKAGSILACSQWETRLRIWRGLLGGGPRQPQSIGSALEADRHIRPSFNITTAVTNSFVLLRKSSSMNVRIVVSLSSWISVDSVFINVFLSQLFQILLKYFHLSANKMVPNTCNANEIFRCLKSAPLGQIS